MILKRAEMGKNFGVVMLPEGLIEFIPEFNALISDINDVLASGIPTTIGEVWCRNGRIATCHGIHRPFRLYHTWDVRCRFYHVCICGCAVGLFGRIEARVTRF